MNEIIIEISKEAKIKTDFYVEVSIDSDSGGIFPNLPIKYSKEDVIKEYELGIRYDIRTLFENCSVSLDNVAYKCILGDAHNDDKELFEDSYIIYLTKQEKEMIKNKLSDGYAVLGIYVRIDNEIFNNKYDKGIN